MISVIRQASMQKGPASDHRRYSALLNSICLFLLIVLLCSAGVVSAQSIAFFPLLDLSADPNGINTQLTERVRQELTNHGEELVPAEDIMRFLVRNRIRTLGKLTTYQASMVGKELGTDLVLQGTVCQITAGESPVLSLNLQLSRTSDAHIVWAQTANLSYSDMTSFLGLKDPHELEDIFGRFFTSLLATLPDHVKSRKESLDRLNIATVYIQPKYLRPGEEVSCKLKMHKTLDDDGTQPNTYIQIGEQQYPLLPGGEGYYLETSWPAEESVGSYPVTLVVKWPSGMTRTGVIGSYSVDDHEPGARLVVIGTEHDGAVLFSDKLVIIPKLLDPEPTSRWEIRVIDEEDEVIVLVGASGNIPRNLTWEGKTSQGNIAPPGEYLIVFKVWDRVEHESSAETKVHFMPEPPELLVEVSKEEERVVVDLDSVTDTPLNFWWAKFYEEDGRLLKLVQGTELPVTIELDVDGETEQKIECLLTARDILGNQYQQKIANLFQLAENDDNEEEASIETEWVEVF